MRKIYKTLIILFIIMVSFTITCEAQPITNYNEMIENGKALDKKEIVVKGEAIGEPMKRGDYTWVNLSDGSTAMGIWLKNEDAAKIKVFGDYKHKGDTIEIIGIFNRACIEHGGDMDIHSNGVIVVDNGYKVEKVINRKRLLIALESLIITVILILANHKSRKNFANER